MTNLLPIKTHLDAIKHSESETSELLCRKNTLFCASDTDLIPDSVQFLLSDET